MEKKFSDMVQLSTRGSLVLMIGQMASTLISAIGAIIIARFLGSTHYGIISIAQIPINVSMLLLNNGISNAIIHFLAESRHENKLENLRPIVVTGFLINMVIGLITTITVYQLAGYLSNTVFKITELEQLIKILSVSLLAQSMVNTSISVFAGFERMELRSLLNILLSILRTITGPALIFFGYGVIGAALGISFPYLATGILSLVLVVMSLRDIPSSSYAINYYVSSFIDYSYPLFLSNLLTGSLNQVFNLILPIYVSASIIGNYSAARNFSTLITFFTVPLNTAFFPLFSKLKPSDRLFKLVFNNIIKYESMVVLPIACAIIILSDHIVLVLYGVTYAQASLFLKILMLHFLLIGFGYSVLPFILSSQKETRVVLRSNVLYLMAGAPLGFYLIPRMGVIGLLFAQLFAPVLGLLYALRWVKKEYDLSIDYVNLFKIIASSFMGILSSVTVIKIMYVNPWAELIIGGGVFMASYLISLPLTGLLKRKNLDDMKQLTSSNKKIQIILEPIYSILMRLTLE